MSSIKVKICGITDPDTANFAAHAGADYIGLIFHPDSPRNISEAKAKAIVESIENTSTKAVAVCVNQTAEQIQQIIATTGITTIQLHGKTSRAQQAELAAQIHRIYVVDVDETGNYHLDDAKLDPKRDLLLFDYKNPGQGTSFNHHNFSYPGEFNYLIAGGLTVDNVIECIKTTNPNGVDVSSGVEITRGKKNNALIKKFIENVKNG